jgi:hypothetical protein
MFLYFLSDELTGKTRLLQGYSWRKETLKFPSQHRETLEETKLPDEARLMIPESVTKPHRRWSWSLRTKTTEFRGHFFIKPQRHGLVCAR